MTKEQLMQEIESLQSQLKEKQQEDIYNEPARHLAMMRDAFIANGFSNEQAYQLTFSLLNSQNTMNIGFARGGLIK